MHAAYQSTSCQKFSKLNSIENQAAHTISDRYELTRVEAKRHAEESAKALYEESKKERANKAHNCDPPEEHSDDSSQDSLFGSVISLCSLLSDDDECCSQWVHLFRQSELRLTPVYILDVPYSRHQEAGGVKHTLWERQWIFGLNSLRTNGNQNKERYCIHLCGLTPESWEERIKCVENVVLPELTEINVYPAVKRAGDSSFRSVCPRCRIFGESGVSWRWNSLPDRPDDCQTSSKEMEMKFLIKKLITLGQELLNCQRIKKGQNSSDAKLINGNILTNFAELTDFEVVAASAGWDGITLLENESEDGSQVNAAALCINSESILNESVISGNAVCCAQSMHHALTQCGVFSTLLNINNRDDFCQHTEGCFQQLQTSQPSMILMYIAGRSCMDDGDLILRWCDSHSESVSHSGTSTSAMKFVDVINFLSDWDARAFSWQQSPIFLLILDGQCKALSNEKMKAGFDMTKMENRPRQLAIICQVREDFSPENSRISDMLKVLLDPQSGFFAVDQPFLETLHILEDTIGNDLSRSLYVAHDGIPRDLCLVGATSWSKQSCQTDEGVPSLSTISEYPPLCNVPDYLLQESEHLRRPVSIHGPTIEEESDGMNFLEKRILDETVGNLIVCSPLGTGKRFLFTSAILSAQKRCNRNAYWIDASSVAMLQSSCMTICNLLTIGPDQDDEEQRQPQIYLNTLVNLLRKTKNWLLILYGITDPALLNVLPSENGLVAALISEKLNDAWKDCAARCCFIEPLPIDKTEAMRYLCNTATEKDTELMISRLSCFPLSLKLVKTLTDLRGWDHSTILEHIDSYEKHFENIEHLPHSFQALVYLHLDDLRQMCPEAVEILFVSSYLSASHIHTAMFKRDDNGAAIDQAIELLCVRLLVVKVTDGFVHMHEALQEVLRKAAKEEKTKFMETAAQSIVRVLQDLDKDQPATTTPRQIAVEHGLAIYRHGCRQYTLLKMVASYLSAVLYDFETSLEMQQCMLDLQKTAHGGRLHADVAAVLSWMGSSCFALQRFSDALIAYEEALSIQEELSKQGQNQPDLALAYTNVASVLERLERIEDAISIYEKLLELQNLFGQQHDIATTLNNMAILYRDLGQDNLAMDNYVRALVIFEEVLDVEEDETTKSLLYVDTAKTLNNIANIHSDSGDYETALVQYEKSLNIKKDIYGPTHIDVATTLDNMGILYYKLGQYAQAIQYHEEAFMIREQELGYEDLSLADTLINLGKAYSKQGQLGDAILAYQNAITIQEQFLGSEDESTATTYMMIGCEYEALGKFEEARVNYEQALRIKGNSSENAGLIVVNTLRGLGNVLLALERYDDALSKYEEALNLCVVDNPQFEILRKEHGSSQYRSQADWNATFLLAHSASCIKTKEMDISEFLSLYRSQYMTEQSLCSAFVSISSDDEKVAGMSKQFIRDIAGGMIRLNGKVVLSKVLADSAAVNEIKNADHEVEGQSASKNSQAHAHENDQEPYLEQAFDGLMHICRGDTHLVELITAVGNQNLGIMMFERVMEHFQEEMSDCLVLQAGNHYVDISRGTSKNCSTIKFEGYFKVLEPEHLEEEAAASVVCASAIMEFDLPEEAPARSIQESVMCSHGPEAHTGDIASILSTQEDMSDVQNVGTDGVLNGDGDSVERCEKPREHVKMQWDPLNPAKCASLSGRVQFHILQPVSVQIFGKDSCAVERLTSQDDTLSSTLSASGSLSRKSEKKTKLLDNFDVAKLHNCLGLVKIKLNRHSEAVLHYEESLILQKMGLGDDHVDIAKALSNLGMILGTLGHHSDALSKCEEAVSIYRKSNSEPSDVAFTLDMLGTVLKNLGRFEDALEKHQEALTLRKAMFGQSHIDVATSLMGMGNVYNGLGEYDDAIECYLEALDIQKQVLGFDHIDVAKTLNNIAIVYRKLGRHDEALSNYEESLKIKKKVFGKVHIDTAKTLGNLANAYHTLGRHDEALFHYQATLEIFKSSFGDKNVETAKTMVNLANVYESMGRHEEALNNFENALPTLQNALGNEHTIVASTLMNMGLVLGSLQRHEEALLKYEEALEIQKRLLGSQHAVVATTLLNIGGVYKVLERNNDALLHYEKSLLIQERVLGRDHTDVALTRYNMADVYERVGKRDKARQSVSLAHSIFAGRLGATHPYTRMTAQWLKDLDKQRAARGGLVEDVPQQYSMRTFYSFPALMIFGFLVLICLVMGDTLDRLWFGERAARIRLSRA